MNIEEKVTRLLQPMATEMRNKHEAANSRCSDSAGSVIPMGTKIPNYGEVSGVTFRDGERYYFLTGGAVSLMPASVIEKIPLQNTEIGQSDEQPTK